MDQDQRVAVDMDVDVAGEVAGEETNENGQDRAGVNAAVKASMPRLPVSKVRRIAKCDPEYVVTASNAIVAAAFATELFVQLLAEDGIMMNHLSSRSKGKGKTQQSRPPRLTLDDLVQSVQRKEQFQFLEDVVTTSIAQVRRASKTRSKHRRTAGAEAHQPTIPFAEAKEDEHVGDLQEEEDENVEDLQEEEEEDLQEEEEEDNEDNGDQQVQQQLDEIDRLNVVQDLDGPAGEPSQLQNATQLLSRDPTLPADSSGTDSD